MEKITSFTIDHIQLQPGLYVSRKDRVGGQTVTTFDLRLTSPNEEPVLNTAEAHTIEHLAATYLRNDPQWKERILYFGPMGCRTGFYLLVAGDLTSADILPLVRDCFRFIRDFRGEVPGASARDCGNYLDMNLPMANYWGGKYAALLENITPDRLVYPGHAPEAPRIKLGIIGAMDVEVATLKEQMEARSVYDLVGMEYCEGLLAGCPAVVVRCGVGKVNAAICAQTLIGQFGVTHIVNTGIAGSLDPALDIGDFVVSRDAMYHDYDINVFGYPIGQVSGMDVLAFPADELLIRAAVTAAEAVHPGHVRLGRVASGDQFVSRKEQKERIIQVTGAVCAEMEGAAIAHTAYRNGVPFVILRAISDKADDSAHMDYPTFEAIAAKNCAQVAMVLASRLAE